ncbi:mandelate racemase/muconate lactonizing enzyme family protein [Exilibacterium tricleocarpae]|uniref:Mandelate racemase/muconate lactonizing enzyme family protein n=1 Tax=Exilibacterium tricleocarpae TaxID=2591008 RepID=A0A545T044_9GAMM|nr:mandelate racemase/muconate lactonizing enzyme family protein [Exilibacterium tricleocarpae]TQV70549.1 mandelate racemase/muconate lactonizing enzyme family protein [Exilibacterium tricleocarpae]
MIDPVATLETFIVTLERDTPYLGPLAAGESVNSRGYIVRRGNKTIYPTVDRSVVVKITTAGGRVGWGETYGICAPAAVCEIIADLLAPTLIGRNPLDAEIIWEDLYDMMRVRGFFGGFYLDAIAGIDIALWDLAGKICEQPLHQLLGGRRHETLPAYVSGLPEADLDARCTLAKAWVDKGFNSIKFAAVVSHQGIVNEMVALREALGPDTNLMVDLHWKFSAAEAIALIRQLESHRLGFAEAPVKPEDVDGLATVARAVNTPIAAGEEWRTVYEAMPRLKAGAISIIQPEMGHTGVTQFLRIARLAESFHCRVAPHATIGVGIFMAASLHASATLKTLTEHEYQHSVFDRNVQLLSGKMSCRAGAYSLPEGPGLGIEPTDTLWKYAEQYS